MNIAHSLYLSTPTRPHPLLPFIHKTHFNFNPATIQPTPFNRPIIHKIKRQRAVPRLLDTTHYKDHSTKHHELQRTRGSTATVVLPPPTTTPQHSPRYPFHFFFHNRGTRLSQSAYRSAILFSRELQRNGCGSRPLSIVLLIDICARNHDLECTENQ